MTYWDEIRFDMSRDGLIELAGVFTQYLGTPSDEMQNFANQILNLIERVPASRPALQVDVEPSNEDSVRCKADAGDGEASWMDG